MADVNDNPYIDSYNEFTLDIQEVSNFPGYASNKAYIIEERINAYLTILGEAVNTGFSAGAFHDALQVFYDAACALKSVATDLGTSADFSIQTFRDELLQIDEVRYDNNIFY